MILRRLFHAVKHFQKFQNSSKSSRWSAAATVSRRWLSWRTQSHFWAASFAGHRVVRSSNRDQHEKSGLARAPECTLSGIVHVRAPRTSLAFSNLPDDFRYIAQHLRVFFFRHISLKQLRDIQAYTFWPRN